VEPARRGCRLAHYWPALAPQTSGLARLHQGGWLRCKRCGGALPKRDRVYCDAWFKASTAHLDPNRGAETSMVMRAGVSEMPRKLKRCLPGCCLGFSRSQRGIPEEWSSTTGARAGRRTRFGRQTQTAPGRDRRRGRRLRSSPEHSRYRGRGWIGLTGRRTASLARNPRVCRRPFSHQACTSYLPPLSRPKCSSRLYLARSGLT